MITLFFSKVTMFFSVPVKNLWLLCATLHILCFSFYSCTSIFVLVHYVYNCLLRACPALLCIPGLSHMLCSYLNFCYVNMSYRLFIVLLPYLRCTCNTPLVHQPSYFPSHYLERQYTAWTKTFHCT